MAAQTNPTIGDSSSDLPTLSAWPQSTPLVWAPAAAISWLAKPTPMIDPIRVCELEAGSPRYQVPTFQMIAAMSSAKTMAKPAEEPTCRMSSTGSRVMMPKATAPVENSTPRKFQTPDQTTAKCGGSEWV